MIDVYQGAKPQPIGSIVSSVTWDFQAMTTTMRTDFLGLDAVSAFDVPNMSGPRALGREVREMRNDIRELQQHTGNFPVRRGSGGGGGNGGSANWFYTRGSA